jgi:chromosome segregation ATPase
MIREMKKSISQLVEINRALALDLDISRQAVARVSRERDQLSEKVAEILWERKKLLRSAEKAAQKANMAEEQLRRSKDRLHQVEKERDQIILQLEESNIAMDEIRSRLTCLPEKESATKSA